MGGGGPRRLTSPPIFVCAMGALRCPMPPVPSSPAGREVGGFIKEPRVGWRHTHSHLAEFLPAGQTGKPAPAASILSPRPDTQLEASMLAIAERAARADAHVDVQEVVDNREGGATAATAATFTRTRTLRAREGSHALSVAVVLGTPGVSFALTNSPMRSTGHGVAGGSSEVAGRAVVEEAIRNLPAPRYGAYGDMSPAPAPGGDSDGVVVPGLEGVFSTPRAPSHESGAAPGANPSGTMLLGTGGGLGTGTGSRSVAWQSRYGVDVLLSTAVLNSGGTNSLASTLHATKQLAVLRSEMNDRGLVLDAHSLEREWAQRYWSYVAGPDTVSVGRVDGGGSAAADPFFIATGGSGAAAPLPAATTSLGLLEGHLHTLSGLLPPVKTSWLEHVRDLLPPAPADPAALDIANAVLARQLTHVGANYVLSCRKAVLDYVLRDPGERKRLNILQVPEGVTGPVLDWGWGSHVVVPAPPAPWRHRVAVGRGFIASHVHTVRPVVREIVASWHVAFDSGARLCAVDLPTSDEAALRGTWRPQELRDFELVCVGLLP
jgi:hypothetical protein